VAGIPIHVHFTLLLLVLWILWLNYKSGGPLLSQALLLAGLFASVLLHELGHALVGRRLGIRSKEIVLYPFGGVARMIHVGAPRHEFWISLAGPATNALVGLAIMAALGFHAAWATFREVLPGTDTLRWLMMANFSLAAFNLLPAFPMDGGRIVRAYLAGRLSMVRATEIAATIGQGFAILMGLAAIFLGHFILMFIAFFIFVSAGQEVAVQRSLAVIRGQRVADAMMTRFEVLAQDATLSQAADLLMATRQQDFPVMAGDEVRGVLTRSDLVQGLANRGPRASVAESAHAPLLKLSPEEELEKAVEKMRDASTQVALVLGDAAHGRRLVGILTEENIGELLTLRQATEGPETSS
jgi:Zn-dependent protease/predicted transcriptional regulator